MPIQRRNDEQVNMLSADLQPRYESGFAWRTACSMIQALPGLRGFWPMSVFNSTGAAANLSGLSGMGLSYNGNPVYGSGIGSVNWSGLPPWIRFDGTADHLDIADAANFDILGTESYVDVPGLTLGGWFRPEDDTPAALEGLISKYDAAGNDRAYMLYLAGHDDDTVRFIMSDDGTNTDRVDSTSTYSTDTWQFMAGRFDDALTGAELAVWLNDEQTTAATARASIKNSAAPFNISGYNSGSNLYTGRASLCFLCAAALADATVWAIYQHTRALFGV